MSIGRFRNIGLAAACATLPLPLIVQAQQTQPAGSDTDKALASVEEVVVTARRRNESVQDVPISIVTKTGEYMEQAQVESLTELDRLVPGFMMKEFESGGQSTMGIRGLSTFSQTGAQQSVGMVVDGVVLAAIGTAVTDFNDVERIEVLRGPQGTLFGKNTTGGVVHVITKDPTDEFEGHVSMGYGSYNEVRWDGTVSGPLADDLSARLSAFTLNREGYIENIHDGAMLGSDDQIGVRTKFLYTPTEGTRLKLGMYYVERHQKGASSGGGQPVVAFGPAASQSSREVNATIVGPHNDKVNGIGQHPFDDQIYGVDLTWEQELGDYTLTSISAFESWDWDFGKGYHTFNPPVTPLPTEKFFAANDLQAWSQEVRLASPSGGFMEYVVGAFSSGSKNTSPLDFLINISGDPDPAAAIYLFDDEVGVSEDLDYAFFGEADFHVTDTVTLTAGTRWTHAEKDVTTSSNTPPGWIPEAGIGVGPAGQLYIPFLGSEIPGFREGSVAAQNWSWRGGVRWEPTANLMFYGTAARGFKGPAISSLSGTYTNVDPEIATSFEVGVKSGFLNNRILANLTLFHANVDDFQAEGSNTIETPNGSVLSIILKNAGKVRTQGVEFELSVLPTEDLTLDFNAAYIDAEYREFKGASCYESQTVAQGCIPLDAADPESLALQDLSGKPLPFTPRFSANASARYDFAIPPWPLRQFVRLDYSYQSEINWNLGIAPLNESDPVSIIGLSLGVSDQQERLEVVGYVKNLTDEFVVNGLNGGNEAISANLQPDYQRTYGIKVNYRFD